MGPPTSELVFVVQHPRGRFANLVSALGELWGGELPPMKSVDAVFDATRNRVLICAHYDPRSLTEGVRTRIHILARTAGVVVLDGAALDESDRRALVDDGEHRVDGQPALAIALWNLARLMGGEEVWAGEPEPPPPLKARSITANEVADRGGVYSVRKRPVGLVPPEDGTRTPTAGAVPSRPPGEEVPKLAGGTQRGLGEKARTAAGSTAPAGNPAARTMNGFGRTRHAAGSTAPENVDSSDSTQHMLAKGSSSRTSTLRDVVAPHAIGSRPASASQSGLSHQPPSQPPPEEQAQARPGSASSSGLTHPRPSGASSSGLSHAKPASASQSGLTHPKPASASQSGLTHPRPANASSSGLTHPRPANASSSGLSHPPPRAAQTITPADPLPVSTRRPTSSPTKPPAVHGRAAEDGTSPRIELDPLRTTSADDELAVGTQRRPQRITAPRVAPPPSELTPPPALVAPGPIERSAQGSPPDGLVISRTSTDDRIESGPITHADPIARAGTHAGTDPYMPALQHRGDSASIDVRYLRSGRWAPARLRALSLKGAYLITAAFPRVGDHVHIALGLGDLGALVRGAVFHVTTAADIASTGTSGFAVRFDLDEAARAQLSVLLHRARARGVTITPPPPRGSVRLPVQWPVKLGTARGAVKGDALDVSRGGMFVHAVRALDVDAPVSFSAVLDDGGSPVSGRARVVREINETDAARRGLRPGFGLSIQEMGDTDVERWNLFLTRVQRRSEHRILVGASPSRLPELTAGLAGAGYAVIGGTDAGTLVQLSDAESRPPDVAVIDATLFEGTEPNWLETLFSARKVPCVTLRGDARRARVVVDRLLAV
jgi:hypothetical protein